MTTARIIVSAVLVRDAAGLVLTVRKRGTATFMLPGGKPEPGESALDAAVREVREELGVVMDPASLDLIGTFTAAAANEPNTTVTATVFEHPAAGVHLPSAEIAELRWVDPNSSADVPLAPLLTQEVFPGLSSRQVRRVTVFTGASIGTDPAHLHSAEALAAQLARQGIGLVYGGGNVGLMGAVADAALRAGGEVIGVMPEHLVAREIAHPGLTRLDTVATMHERKQRMAELGDAFVALPGGAGTLEELFEAWTWQQLGLHVKPVALYGRGFWQPLLGLLDHLVAEGFVRPDDREALCVADDPDELLGQFRAWTTSSPKWGAPNTGRRRATR